MCLTWAHPGPTSRVSQAWITEYEARCALTYPPPAIEHENGRLLLHGVHPSGTNPLDKLCLAKFGFM